MGELIIEVLEFPTHVMLSKAVRAKKDEKGVILNPEKVGKPSYKKISGQVIYSSAKFIRSKFMSDIHEYLKTEISKNYNVVELREALLNKEIKIKCLLHVPYNYDLVAIRGGILRVPEIKPNYVPRWDIDNLGYPWCKGFNDVLQELNIIDNDDVSIVKGVSVEFVREDNFYQRKLVFIIQHTNINNEEE